MQAAHRRVRSYHCSPLLRLVEFPFFDFVLFKDDKSAFGSSMVDAALLCHFGTALAAQAVTDVKPSLPYYFTV